MKSMNQWWIVFCAACLIVMSMAGCGKEDQAQPEVPAPTVSVTEPTVAPTEPPRQVMDTPDLAEYVQERTVTINVEDIDGNAVAGSGFFIDDEGMLVTCYHVIDAAKSISVEISDGGKYTVEEIVDFDEVYDIAVLKVDLEGNPYLEICQEKSRTGETVYAVGSSLGFLSGTFSNGIISNASSPIGSVDCIQTTAAISSGNSGGPLVNVYGEVIGINAFSYAAGENLNLAVHADMLQKLSMDKNWDINRYREWYKKEVDRSYGVWNYTLKEWEVSKINTYQHVTGQKCFASDFDFSILEGDTDSIVEGYHEGYGVYFYEYDVKECDSYTEYLHSIGFTFDRSEDYNTGISYYYENEYTGHKVDIFVVSGDEYVVIEPYCY